MYEGLEMSMVYAGDVPGEQQCLRTAGAVPSVFCDSRMCQPCLVALGAGHLPHPSTCYPMAALAPRVGMVEQAWTEYPGREKGGGV